MGVRSGEAALFLFRTLLNFFRSWPSVNQLADPAVRQHHELLTAGVVAQFDEVAHCSALGDILDYPARATPFTRGSKSVAKG
jgi:hypothetical protein